MKGEVEVGRGEIKKVERGDGNSENHHIKVNYVYIMYSVVFVKRDDNWCIKAGNLIGRVLFKVGLGIKRDM